MINFKKITCTLFLGIISIFFNISIAENDAFSFADWKIKFSQKAHRYGISNEQLDKLLDLDFYEKAIKHDQNQYEFKKFLWDYLQSIVSDYRIEIGREKFVENKVLLSEISQKTGVLPQIIIAIWGVESKYGNYIGKVPVVQSMAALAYEGRRRVFFENELLVLLELIDKGDISDFDVRGSWAGGLGMPQFIPSSYKNYGIDHDGDGVVNLWQSDDTLASIANYLSQSGWKAGHGWGEEVRLVSGFNYLHANSRQFKTLNEWQILGVRDIGHTELNNNSIMARLYVPAGQYGPKFLLYDNFDVIKRYNNSDSYALAVCLLSDIIAGGARLQARWPDNGKENIKNDIKIIQKVLSNHGYDAGKVDGILGANTIRALQYYQADRDLVADGFLTNDLYEQLIASYNEDTLRSDIEVLP